MYMHQYYSTFTALLFLCVKFSFSICFLRGYIDLVNGGDVWDGIKQRGVCGALMFISELQYSNTVDSLSSGTATGVIGGTCAFISYCDPQMSSHENLQYFICMGCGEM